jgi:hypothetical protein
VKNIDKRKKNGEIVMSVYNTNQDKIVKELIEKIKGYKLTMKENDKPQKLKKLAEQIALLDEQHLAQLKTTKIKVQSRGPNQGEYTLDIYFFKADDTKELDGLIKKEKRKIQQKRETAKHFKEKVLPELEGFFKKREQEKYVEDNFKKTEKDAKKQSAILQKEIEESKKAEAQLKQKALDAKERFDAIEKKVLVDVKKSTFEFSYPKNKNKDKEETKIGLNALYLIIESKYKEKREHSFFTKSSSRDEQLSFLKSMLTNIEKHKGTTDYKNKLIKGMILYTIRAIDKENPLFSSGLKKVLEETLKGLKLENVDSADSINAVHALLNDKNFKLKILAYSDKKLKDIEEASKDTQWIATYNKTTAPKPKKQ